MWDSTEENPTLQSAAILRIVNSVENAMQEANDADPVIPRSFPLKYDT